MGGGISDPGNKVIMKIEEYNEILKELLKRKWILLTDKNIVI